jgi:predicted nucleotidyltransferase
VHGEEKTRKALALKLQLEEEFGTSIDIIRLHDGINAFLKKRIHQEAIYV